MMRLMRCFRGGGNLNQSVPLKDNLKYEECQQQQQVVVMNDEVKTSEQV